MALWSVAFQRLWSTRIAGRTDNTARSRCGQTCDLVRGSVRTTITRPGPVFSGVVEHRAVLTGGDRPLAVGRAPGRVNIIGDHVDYCGGLVMPMALPHACVAVVLPGRTDAGRCVVSSTHSGEREGFSTASVPEPGADAPVGSWASYIIGAVAEVAGNGDLSKLSGCEIRVHSDVPLGAGLSSSAALEVSVAIAAAAVTRTEMSGLDLARRCQRAEHRFAGMPCGLMDQAASVLGEVGHAILLDCATEEPTPISVPDAAAFVVVNSGVKHALADGAYAERRALCESAAQTLGVEHLAHADIDAALKLEPGPLEAARHVIGETGRVRDAASAFEKGDLPRVGELMLASHASLRDDFRVSCDELDLLVDRLRGVAGVYGVRMTGGGFGGSVVALVERGSEPGVVDAAEGCRDACPKLAAITVTPGAGAALLAVD
ncbi:MAG: galactokinase [Planctomycetota bacterium]